MEKIEPALQSQQTNVPIATEVSSNLKPTNNKQSTNLIFVSLFVLLLGVAGVLAYKYFELKQQIDNQQSTLPTTIDKAIVTIVPTQPSPSVTMPSASSKTYINKKYRFSFDYPQTWQINEILEPDSSRVSFSNVADNHTISIEVGRVTGFGYCYKYGEKKEISVGGMSAETADGAGGSEMCDKPEEFVNRGNTYILIPLEDKSGAFPTNQIHISYEYPSSDTEFAKSNLKQIISTFRFSN